MKNLISTSLAAATVTCAAPAFSQSCAQVNKGIATISDEIRSMQSESVSDNSAPRETMRAARMSFGAQAQANLIEYGKILGCKFSGLKLPTSIKQQSTPAEGGNGAL
jgi:hypothetical protein